MESSNDISTTAFIELCFEAITAKTYQTPRLPASTWTQALLFIVSLLLIRASARYMIRAIVNFLASFLVDFWTLVMALQRESALDRV